MNAPLPTRTTALSSNGTELTGAEILWEVLVREGVEVVFAGIYLHRRRCFLSFIISQGSLHAVHDFFAHLLLHV